MEIKLAKKDIERLAAALFKKMEHMDPSDMSDINLDDWGYSKLDEIDKIYHRSCVIAVLQELADGERIRIATVD